MDQSEDQSHASTWHDLHLLKAPRLKEQANLNTPCHIEAHPRARITIHVSSFVPNHTAHNLETVLPNARLYKGEFASFPRYHSLSTTISHTLSEPITDLSVRVQTCLQAPFVPPRRLIIAVSKVVTVTPEN